MEIDGLRVIRTSNGLFISLDSLLDHRTEMKCDSIRFIDKLEKLKRKAKI